MAGNAVSDLVISVIGRNIKALDEVNKMEKGCGENETDNAD